MGAKGHLRERPEGSGRWQLRVAAGLDPQTRKYRYETKTFSGTENQARRAVKDFGAEVEAGIGTDVDLAAVLADWVEMKTTTWAPSTLNTNQVIIDTKSNPALVPYGSRS